MQVEILARQIGGKIFGDSNLDISGISSFDEADSNQAVIVLAQKYLNTALASKAGAVVLDVGITFSKSSKTIITVVNSRLAMAKALSLFPDRHVVASGIHNTAVIAESVVFQENISIGAGCIVGEEVQIGENTVLHPGVIVYSGVMIGKNVVVHSGAVLGGDGFGYVRSEGQIVKVPQRGGLVIHDHVEIGANTTIDKGTISPTIIGSGTKIDNLVQIAHNCKIGKNCLIAASGAIGGSSVLDDNVTLAGFVAVGDHVHIGENVVVGGRAGVIKDIPSNSVVSGFPAQDHRKELRFWAKLRRLVRS